MKFDFKKLIRDNYNVFELSGVAVAFYGAMTASTLLGFIEPLSTANCFVFIVIGMGVSVISMTKREISNNENI